MILQGKLIAESPIYRGNSRKTLFTRDGEGKQKLVSLAGEISGTAQSLMDAFIGKSKNRRNTGLILRLWERLYTDPFPEKLISRFECRLQDKFYPRNNFFDMRMGLRLNEDRGAAESNANYKMETILKNSVFDVTIHLDEIVLKKGENKNKLFYLFEELKEGRFWFGAGKSKGLGRCRLEMDLPFEPSSLPKLNPQGNFLNLSLKFDLNNPVLVGWNWGKLDPNIPAFAAVEGRLLVESLQQLPTPIRQRLEMGIGGPILTPEDWKKKLSNFLPRAIASWLLQNASKEETSWLLSSKSVAKLSKGKYPVSKKMLEPVQPLLDKGFSSEEEIKNAITEAIGKSNEKKGKRIYETIEQEKRTVTQWDAEIWKEITSFLDFGEGAEKRISACIDNEAKLISSFREELKNVIKDLFRQVDRQIKLLQSDSWIDTEIAVREEHLRIKTMLIQNKINERQWQDPNNPPNGIKTSVWKEFLNAHSRVQFHHMVNQTNLRKSITNDKNFIDFLNDYRNRTRGELVQACNTDFRIGGDNNLVSRRYGKNYDKILMRMLSWNKSKEVKDGWEIFIPGGTIKGAFRKRASQVLKTIWGESSKTTELINKIFGAQSQKGLILFSDAYLNDPEVPEKKFCAMDSVKMNLNTGKPLEEAKADYLFLYGKDLSFKFRFDIQDIKMKDMEAISFIKYLINDFQKGDVSIGGEKSSGFGWVKGEIENLLWLTASDNEITKTLFKEHKSKQEGIWKRIELNKTEAEAVLTPDKPLSSSNTSSDTPPKTYEGYISHRAFGGYCGNLVVELTALTPLHISESGQPSFRTTIDGKNVNGWDFFSIKSPDNNLRDENRSYVVPSKSLKGVIRQAYSITSNSLDTSSNISRLNPSDSLFGWVGIGANQALASRLTFDFGYFDSSSLSWFKVPYPYSGWIYDGQWKLQEGKKVPMVKIANNWRFFPHTPLAPIVKKLDSFEADTVQSSYFRAIMPGEKCRFTIRFINMEKSELERLIWCLTLEEDLAHKMGKHRYLGLGSVKFKILPESHFIDWESRYTEKEESKSKIPINLKEWHNPKVIEFYSELKKALDAKCI